MEIFPKQLLLHSGSRSRPCQECLKNLYMFHCGLLHDENEYLGNVSIGQFSCILKWLLCAWEFKNKFNFPPICWWYIWSFVYTGKITSSLPPGPTGPGWNSDTHFPIQLHFKEKIFSAFHSIYETAASSATTITVASSNRSHHLL